MTSQANLPAASRDDHPDSDAARAMRIGLATILVLACAIPFAMNVVDPDLWGHIQYGQDWLAAGTMPRTATHTFTADGYPWINHENAFELAAAWGNLHVGIYGLLVAKCLLGVGIAWGAVRIAMRHGVPPLITWSLLVLVAASLQAFFPLRPQLFSFVLCAAMLALLDLAFTSWFEDRRVRWAWLAPMPLILAAWVNSHGGFAAGLCILAAYFGGRTFEAVRADGLRKSPSTIGGLAIVGLASLAATFANPYGFELHRWMAYAMWTPQPEITEWLPPTWDNPVCMPFLSLCVVAGACLTLTRKPRDWTQIVILVLVGAQAWMHLRHIAFFALCCAFWLPVHWHSTFVRLAPASAWNWFAPSPKLWVQLRSMAVVLVGIGVESFILAGRLTDFPVVRSTYPVDAFQYIVDERLGGKLVVSFNWAQYAIAALAPEVTVGFDGRFDTCYPDEVIDMHFDFLLGSAKGHRSRNPTSGPIDREKILAFGSPDMVLIDRRYKDPVEVMHAEAKRKNPPWTLLYSDSIAELWGRSTRYNDPQSAAYFPPDRRRLNVRLLQARFQWPALPDRSLWEGHTETEMASNLHGGL